MLGSHFKYITNNYCAKPKHSNSRLGNKPIQEVVAAMDHYGAQRAGVMTNSTFTDAAKQLARENGVLLSERVV